MKIVRSIKTMSRISRGLALKGCTVGFVPTMGALHAGHLSLIRRARRENDKVIVSIFVNPVQFGKNEDFSRYPRRLKTDAGLCRKAGVDFIFYPAAKEMYPEVFRTFVLVEGLSDALCGRFRPGHFRGVATIVAKLFNIVSPDNAYFGRKDAQQALIIKRMVEDLNLRVKVRVMPTVREKDGLALSSRNQYLNFAERQEAAILYAALKAARAAVRKGTINPAAVIKQIRRAVENNSRAKIEYAAAVDTRDLSPAKKISRGVLLALAARMGKTRLIDNIIV